MNGIILNKLCLEKVIEIMLFVFLVWKNKSVANSPGQGTTNKNENVVNADKKSDSATVAESSIAFKKSQQEKSQHLKDAIKILQSLPNNMSDSSCR